MSISRITVITICFILFSGCSAPPQEAIEKRWEIVDMKGSGREHFMRMKKIAEENRKINEWKGIEFTKEGKCNFYDEGVLKSEVSYTIASDGKSLLLKDPNEKENMPVKILELNSDRLIITSQVFQNDTVILKAK